MAGYSESNFGKFAADATTGTILGLRKMAGSTFTESDRRAIEDGLLIVRTALVQPVGMPCADRVSGAVSESEYSRGVMQVLMGCMQLWASGKLDEVEVD